jgi:NAD+ diphosphatase
LAPPGQPRYAGSMPEEFVPSTAFATQPGPDALWFAFRNRELLVLDDLTLPRGPAPATPVRQQFLGTFDGAPCFSAELAPDAAPPPGASFHGLRQLFTRLSPARFALAGRAVQVMEWDRTSQFCGACGTPTVTHATTRARVCPACQLSQYPRVSPAIIVAVERGSEILLVRPARSTTGTFTVVAGFIDPGETAVDAVGREVLEETGVRVKNVRYFDSQPWPFPHQLMLGFHAEHAGGEPIPDGDEIEAVAFFDVTRLPPLFPGRISISKWLIEDFCRRHGHDLPA